MKYGLVGLVNFFVDFSILNLFYTVFHIDVIFSAAAGFIAGSILGFILHSRWTFSYNTQGKKILKYSQFLTVSGVGLILTVTIVYILSNKFHVYYNISKLIAVGISILWAYLANRWWVFNKNIIK
jgi:putative flippase GtrA